MFWGFPGGGGEQEQHPTDDLKGPQNTFLIFRGQAAAPIGLLDDQIEQFLTFLASVSKTWQSEIKLQPKQLIEPNQTIIVNVNKESSHGSLAHQLYSWWIKSRDRQFFRLIRALVAYSVTKNGSSGILYHQSKIGLM